MHEAQVTTRDYLKYKANSSWSGVEPWPPHMYQHVHAHTHARTQVLMHSNLILCVEAHVLKIIRLITEHDGFQCSSRRMHQITNDCGNVKPKKLFPNSKKLFPSSQEVMGGKLGLIKTPWFYSMLQFHCHTFPLTEVFLQFYQWNWTLYFSIGSLHELTSAFSKEQNQGICDILLPDKSHWSLRCV